MTRTGTDRIELEQDRSSGLPWIDHGTDWTVGLTAEQPLDLRIDAGAHQGRLDLREVQLRSLELHTGASETTVLLPRAAGATTVVADVGASALTLDVPSGVAARIRGRVTVGDTRIDESRFPRTGTGFESPDYATAANRIDIELSGGAGSVKVVGGA